MKKRGEQFLNLEGLHPSLRGTQVPEVITGAVARHVMHQADIVQTKADAPHIAQSWWGVEMGRGHPYGTVHTSQAHLHVPTLSRYAAGDIPEFDPDYDYDDEPGTSDVRYEPETYEHGGKTWIAEGHHRIVADRLRRR
jgi:hypothetical protein